MANFRRTTSSDVCTPRRSVWRTHRTLIVPVAVGLLLRLVWIASATRSPTAFADPIVYLASADATLRGDLMTGAGFPLAPGGPTSFLSVAYPTMLGGLSWLALGVPSPFQVAIFANLVASVALILGCSRLAGHFGSGVSDGVGSRAAVAGAWLMAVWPDAIVASGLVMTELPAAAALVWATVLVAPMATEPTVRRGVLVGATVGLAVALRPAFQLVLVAVLFAYPVIKRARGTAGEPLVRAALAMCLAAGVVIAPFAWNSTIRVDAGPGITSATWINICDGAFTSDGSFEPQEACTPPDRDMFTDPEYEAAWVRHAQSQAIDRITDSPVEWLANVPERLANTIDLDGWAVEVTTEWSGQRTPALAFSLALWLSRLSLVLLGLLVAIGVARLWRRSGPWPRPAGVGLVVAATTLFGVAVSFGQPRFLWPITAVVLLPIAAVGAAGVWMGLDRRQPATPGSTLPGTSVDVANP